MRRIPLFILLCLAVVPAAAQAIQLHWSSGAVNLAFTEATRCTLIVESESPEVSLPAEWQLLWVADSTQVEFAALDSLDVCAGDTARVYDVEAPATPEDSTANRWTAQFCSGGSSAATSAGYMLDLPSWARGKLKVVALSPADSTTVLESNEVMFNGGVSDPYPSVVLAATSVHRSLQLAVTARGAGLDAVSSLTLVASDSSWTLPLTVTGRASNSVTAVASVAALMPACEVAVGTERGMATAASLAADPEPEAILAPASGGCSAQFFEELLWPAPSGHGYTIQPKDLAFVRGFIDTTSDRFALHAFYIRKNYWYSTAQNDLNEKNIGHTWTTDFTTWFPTPTDTTALTVRPGKFDELHVWAPTIVQRGPTFLMFYAGVRSEGGRQNQRIGVATSSDLNTWTQEDAPVLTVADVPWAKKDPSGWPFYGSQQLRDPFVMADPVSPGDWLMYFIAEDSLRVPMIAVGVAKSSDLRTWAVVSEPFVSTEDTTDFGVPDNIESPHVFQRNGQWWMPYTVNGEEVFFETTKSADPTVVDPAAWSNPVRLRNVTQGHPAQLQYWHSTEHLKITSAAEYLAAWNDNASSIEIGGLFATDSVGVDSFRLYCPEIAGVAEKPAPLGNTLMSISRLRWGSPQVGVRLELPFRMAVRVAVYDIAGRRLTTLLDGELPAGVSELNWRGKDENGVQLASGVYFIRLTCAAGVTASKIVMLR